MKKNFVLLSSTMFIFLLAFLFSNPVFSMQESPNKYRNIKCGPLSLLAICRLLGVKADLEELSRLADFDEKMGTTMYDLYQAAKHKGLNAVGMRVNLEELSNLKSPAITSVKDNHFLVIEKIIGDNIRIVDPPKEPYLISKEEFVKIYDGSLLVISKKKSSPKSLEPGIEFEEYVYDFKEADQEEKISHTFKFKNIGQRELEITKIRTSCSCTVAPASSKKILPGEEGEIKVTFDPRSNCFNIHEEKLKDIKNREQLRIHFPRNLFYRRRQKI